MNRALFLAAMMTTTGWAAATYTFSSSNLSNITNYTSCAVGPCANYGAGMNITGSFTMGSALPPNSSGANDISSQVVAYSFTDGINTYSSTNPKTRIYQFNIATDGSGNITVGSILLVLWQTGTSPHAIGDRFALINLNGPAINQAQNNLRCTSVGAGTGSGVADDCVSGLNDASSSLASAGSGAYSSPVASAPPATPAPPSLVLMLAGLGTCGLYLLSRRKPAF